MISKLNLKKIKSGNYSIHMMNSNKLLATKINIKKDLMMKSIKKLILSIIKKSVGLDSIKYSPSAPNLMILKLLNDLYIYIHMFIMFGVTQDCIIIFFFSEFFLLKSTNCISLLNHVLFRFKVCYIYLSSIYFTFHIS